MNRNKQSRNSNAIYIFFAPLFIGAFYGWVLNIIDIFNSSFSEITGILVLRVIGVFIAPLGAVLGYL
jgi:hypothetical protein